MIIPSIDLSKGKAVQLKQGRDKILENNSPLSLAEEFNQFGEIAVIDLDSAFKKGNNEEIIKEICAIADCRVGGGISTLEKAEKTISYGAHKIIIGTKAFVEKGANHDFLKALSETIGRERMIIAIDSYRSEIVTEGWKKKTGIKTSEIIKQLEPYASELLFTLVEREGMMQGTDIEMIKQIREASDLVLTVAGGISSLEEIETIAKLNVNMQLGMALYTGKITLPDALIASLNWKSELIPTITVNSSSQVLMMAYSNRESLNKTFKTSNAWYYSRSREKLWMKGETSGNTQKVRKIRTDCDCDTLLLTVDQTGGACHTGSYSCFGDRAFSVEELQSVIRQRIESAPKGSYTASLTDNSVREKIMEEAAELVEADKENDIIWEAADLIYFTMVLLAREKIPFEAVLKELRGRRRRKKTAKG